MFLAGIVAIGVFLLQFRKWILADKKAEDNEARLDAIRRKKEIENEVDDRTDPELIAGILRRDGK